MANPTPPPESRGRGRGVSAEEKAQARDVSLRRGVQTVVLDSEERLGPIDILVNNAGMAAAQQWRIRSASEEWARGSTG